MWHVEDEWSYTIKLIVSSDVQIDKYIYAVKSRLIRQPMFLHLIEGVSLGLMDGARIRCATQIHPFRVCVSDSANILMGSPYISRPVCHLPCGSTKKSPNYAQENINLGSMSHKVRNLLAKNYRRNYYSPGFLLSEHSWRLTGVNQRQRRHGYEYAWKGPEAVYRAEIFVIKQVPGRWVLNGYS